MKTNAVAREPKMPVFDMKMVSVSDIKRDYSKVIKEVDRDKEPAFVMNHNTPEAVLMSYRYYKAFMVEMRQMIEEISSDIERLEDTQLYAEASSRLKKDNLTWVESDLVFADKAAEEDNPYSGMSDEELFDS
jgi:prevent-host-death family protein